MTPIRLVKRWLPAGALALVLSLPAAASAPAPAGNNIGDALDNWIGGSLSGSYLAARYAARLRDYDAAALFFDSTLSMDPANPGLLTRAFVLHASTGQWAKADELARRIVKNNPRQRLANIVLGLKAAESGDFARARKYFKASAYTPVGELSGGLLMAWTWAGEKNFAKAVEAMKALDKHESFSNFKSFHSALIADLLHSPSRAEGLYAKAWKEISGSLRITQGYGSFLRRTGKREKAREVYKAFLANAPENAIIRQALKDLDAGRPARPLVNNAREGMAEALFSLASALTDDRSIDIALVYAQMALRMRPDFPVADMLLGQIYENTRRYEKAIEAYGRIPKEHPLYVPARIQIALALDDLKRPDEAISLLRALAARHPEAYKVFLTLGNILRSHEKWKQAAEAYSRALARMGEPQPRHWSIYYFRGIANERSGHWPEAEADFRLALKLNPDHPSVLNYLGYSLIDKGRNLDEALNMVRKAVDARPNDGYIVDSLGWAYYKLGRYKDAVKHLERAVELRPEDPVINDHLGDAYWRVGRRLEARFQWLHARDNKPDPDVLKRIREKLKHGLESKRRAKPAEKTAAAPVKTVPVKTVPAKTAPAKP